MTTASNSCTPSTAASSPTIAPATTPKQETLSMKPIAAAVSPAPPTQSSVTSREWVIPPRPKPGRKPATDTPPTKRKAQNRAAQRAFRERRAARVGELEEQMRKVEEENEQHEEELKERIDTLSEQLEECRSDVLWWRKRCQTLESDLSEAKRTKEVSPKISHPASNENASGTVTGGCENCSSEKCQCIDDAFNLSSATETANDSATKRPSSPPHQVSAKRHKSDAEVKPDPEEMEIDFTHSFTSRHQLRNQENSVSPTTMLDPCGFCQDGTPCICAEMAAEQATERPNYIESNKLAPIQNVSQFTPPPSEGDVLSEPLPSINNIKANSCANGPGTCSQCLVDPRRTLFCKSLAASRSSSAPGGCCSETGNAPKSGCCQSRSPGQGNEAKTQSNNPETRSPSVTLTCSDTFTTLSRHPNFSRASDELSSWLPRLHTLPSPRNLNVSNRPTMEVEAASVMGVLRYFDRRFAD